MDFSFSDKDLAFRDEARAWLEANLPAAWRRDHCWTRVEDPMWIEVARDWQRMLADGGWAAISWPKSEKKLVQPIARIFRFSHLFLFMLSPLRSACFKAFG